MPNKFIRAVTAGRTKRTASKRRRLKVWNGLALLFAVFLAVGGMTAVAQEAKALPIFKRVVVDNDPPKQPYYKMVGDVTGDGNNDIVVAGRVGPIVKYSGPEWEKTIIAAGGYKGGVNGELADINGDGKLDIVMGGVVWFENPETSSVEWKVHRIDEQNIHDVEVADLNADGLLDIVCRDQSAFGKRGNEIFVYYQTAPNNWKKERIECPHGEGLKVADIDGDGKPDIVIGAIWFKHESGNWSSHVYAPAWTELDTKVEVGDINGDGRADIVLTPAELKGERYKISWFESPVRDKTAPWNENVIVPDTECVIHSLALGDFDRDGELDVAFAEMHQGVDPDDVVVMFNVNKGDKWNKLVIDSSGSHDIVAADVDSDGDLDIVGANHAEVHPVILWENQLVSKTVATAPTDSLDNWRRHLIGADRPERAIYVYPGDLDGDGLPDIITGSVWYRNPGHHASEWTRKEIGTPLHNVALVFDFDKDGHLDILGTKGIGSNASHEFVWAENDGHGNFAIHENVDTGGSGDFLQGVSLFESVSGDRSIGLSWHNGGGGIHKLTVPSDPKESRWSWMKVSGTTYKQDLCAADITGDGLVDFIIGPIWFRNEGGGKWTELTLHRTGQTPDRVRMKDINGDGRLDVLIGYLAISKPGTLAWYEQPESLDRVWKEHVVSENIVGPMSIDMEDIDKDGDTDLVVGEHNLRQPETASVFIFENLDRLGHSWRQHLVHTGDEHHDGTIFVDIDKDDDLDIISIGWGHKKTLLYENQNGPGRRKD